MSDERSDGYERGEAIERAEDESGRAQKFFSDLKKSTQAPHYAEKQREWVNQLLNRAIEAQLYYPETP